MDCSLVLEVSVSALLNRQVSATQRAFVALPNITPHPESTMANITNTCKASVIGLVVAGNEVPMVKLLHDTEC